METWRLGLLLTAALLATASFAEGKRRPFRSIKAPKGEREIAGGLQPDQIDFKMLYPPSELADLNHDMLYL